MFFKGPNSPVFRGKSVNNSYWQTWLFLIIYKSNTSVGSVLLNLKI